MTTQLSSDSPATPATPTFQKYGRIDELEAAVREGSYTFPDTILKGREEAARRFKEWQKHEAYFERRREEYLAAPTEKEKARILELIRNDPYTKSAKVVIAQQEAEKAERKRKAAEAAEDEEKSEAEE